MRHNQFRFILLFFCTAMLSHPVKAQSWNFIKEKDSIKIYTRSEAGKSLKFYRAVTTLNAPIERIYGIMEDVNNTDWWDKRLTHIKVLLYEKDKRAQYYFVYDLPSPITDRDLCVEVTVTIDKVTGERRINAVSLDGIIPERNDMVRIKDYRQAWTINPVGKKMTHIILEGFVDPAGAIPDWISNMLITESPMKTITGLKERIRKE